MAKKTSTDQIKKSKLTSELSLKKSFGNLGSDKPAAEQVTDTKSVVQALMRTLIDKNAAEVVSKSASGNSKDKPNAPLPTYNVRTPIVKIKINNHWVYPLDGLTIGGSNQDMREFFKSLEVSYPFGGVETTITGTVSLYARNPSIIIQALDTSSNNKKESEYPKMTLQWGWKLATGTEVKEILTPELDFLILDVKMGSFDSIGTDFTLSIQEYGSTVARLSSLPGGMVDPDYPQEQIRTIVEGLLGFRLFTLDDLLAMSGKTTTQTHQEMPNGSDKATDALTLYNKVGQNDARLTEALGKFMMEVTRELSNVVGSGGSTSYAAGTGGSSAINGFNNPLTGQTLAQLEAEQIRAHMQAADGSTWILGIIREAAKTAVPFSQFKTEALKIRAKTVYDSDNDKVSNQTNLYNNYGAEGSKIQAAMDNTNTALHKVEVAYLDWNVSCWDSTVGPDNAASAFYNKNADLDKTFRPGQITRYKTAMEDVLSKSNNGFTKEMDVKTTLLLRYINEYLASQKIQQQVTAPPAPVTITEEVPISKAKTFFANDRTATVHFNSDNFAKILEELASRCRCRWFASRNEELAQVVSNVNTNTKDYKEKYAQLQQELYSKKSTPESIGKLTAEVNNLKIQLASTCRLYWVPNVPLTWKTTGHLNTSEPGAFFLLPDILDMTGDPLDIQLTYGPGASKFPYLHGSAMNVFNSAISSTGQPSQTFGDIKSLEINYSNLITFLNSSIVENSAFVNEGNYLTSVDRAIAGNVTVKPVKQEPDKQKWTQQDHDNYAKVIETERVKMKQSVKTNNFRFIGVVGQTGLNTIDVFDNPTIALNADNRSRKNYTDSTVYSETQLKSRINNFLKYPLNATINVLGDPTLLRLTQGGFEIISYYPTDSLGNNHTLNPMVSGVYHALKITHRVAAGDYTTTLSGIKVAANIGVTNQISTEIKKELKTSTNDNTEISKKLRISAVDVDLSSKEFQDGFLSKSLQDTLSSYRSQQVATKGSN